MPNEYEKSLDNRRAAMVSRERCAPRARQDCNPCELNELRLISLLIMGRGAQVSRAAREPNAPISRPACSELVEPAHRALLPFAGSRERRPPEWDAQRNPLDGAPRGKCNILQNAENVAFCCILLHGTTRRAAGIPLVAWALLTDLAAVESSAKEHER